MKGLARSVAALLCQFLIAGCAAAQVAIGTVPPVILDVPSNSGNILYAQQTDASVSWTPSLARSFVWAGSQPIRWLFSGAYIPAFRLPAAAACAQSPAPDGCPSPSAAQNLAWMQSYHPDWIVYACDQVTPLADTPADNIYDIDFTSATPRAFMAAWARTLLNQGYTGIALDNVSIANTSGRCGHYAGATPGGGPLPASGGVWHLDFSAGAPQNDPLYTAGVLDYIGWLKSQVNAYGGRLATNTKIITADLDSSAQLAALGEPVYFESVFTHACANDGVTTQKILDSSWTARLPTVAVVSNADVRIILSNYLCNHPEASITNDEASWIVANVLFFKNAETSITVTNGTHTGVQDAGTYINYQSFMNPPVGAPLDVAGLKDGGGCYYRRYGTGGVALVNPSSTVACTYTLPAGTYVDQFGNAVASGSNTLSPSIGLVAVKTG